MQYMGGKARIAKDILSIMLKNRKFGQYWVEPFVGGANIIDKVKSPRIGNDCNKYLIALWNSLIYDLWSPPKFNKEEYQKIRVNKAAYPEYVVGWIGFICTYSSKFFGGWANTTIRRNYQRERTNNIMRQIPFLQGVVFTNSSYDLMEIPPNSIIYCDPPYANTTKYKGVDFNHDDFWDWCRKKNDEGHTVWVSEYNAPEDFICVWQKSITNTVSQKKVFATVEKLFTII